MQDDERGKALGTYEDKRDTVHIAFWLENLKEGTHFKDLGADGRIILKLIFNKEYQRF